MWKVLKILKYILTFAYLVDFKAGQDECRQDHKRRYEEAMKRQFLENMVKSNEEDDEFGMDD